LDCGNGPIQGLTSISVTNLPADIAAGYSVVIYTFGGVTNRPALYLANGNGPLYVKPGGPGGIASFYKASSQSPRLVGDFVQAIGDDAANGPNSYGNYIVFTGLSGDLDIQALPNTFRAAVNAIQIVKNP